MDDWEVSASDDEWNDFNPPESASTINSIYIPQRLARLFQNIQDDKVLKLTCFCQRIGATKDVQQNNNNNNNNNIQAVSPLHQPDERIEREVQQSPEENNKSFEAFDFDTDDSEKPSLKRKTPGSAKRGKKEKVGSMSNVMSDLLRHKFLDDLEATKNEESNNETKAN